MDWSNKSRTSEWMDGTLKIIQYLLSKGTQNHTGRNCFNLFQISFSANTADAHPWFLILLNFGWMVDLAMSIFEFLTNFLIYWHPWHPWGCICSVCWKWNLKQIEAIPPSVNVTLEWTSPQWTFLTYAGPQLELAVVQSSRSMLFHLIKIPKHE